MGSLIHEERPADGEAAGLLVLHHGRGTDERDLLPLADALDPARRLHVVSPRGALTLPGWPGYHWYAVPRVGYPDPETFHAAFGALSDFHDQFWAGTGLPPERTVLGGFSMGSVMSYALGLAGQRPAAAGLLIFSGFVPTVNGWEPDVETRQGMPVFIAHGRADPIMEVEFGRQARRLLEDGGLDVSYHESDVGHGIDPAHIPAAATWLDQVVPASPG